MTTETTPAQYRAAYEAQLFTRLITLNPLDWQRQNLGSVRGPYNPETDNEVTLYRGIETERSESGEAYVAPLDEMQAEVSRTVRRIHPVIDGYSSYTFDRTSIIYQLKLLRDEEAIVDLSEELSQNAIIWHSRVQGPVERLYHHIVNGIADAKVTNTPQAAAS